ncbi:BRCT domain-containing protein [Qipengyuania sp. ASV99]|uniref:BRCT domain-containing protein n=1 Tax=Qipengyuania sp. ASV99 TaxID=3399681 RepID=UPI003A4C76DE
MAKNDQVLNTLGRDRISSRQVDELIGLARGVCADGIINEREAEFLMSWLAANASVSDQPLIGSLYKRISEMLSDGELDVDEQTELLETLGGLTGGRVELGEVLKATTLPICRPPPILAFSDQKYCFTGTFAFGQRKQCEAAIIERGGSAGSLTMKTNVLVIGEYATESWKHSSMGNKILKAVEMRDQGFSISIVDEQHWRQFL